MCDLNLNCEDNGDCLKELPESVKESIIDLKNVNTTESFLMQRLPRGVVENIKQELQKKFPLAKERQVYRKRLKRQGCPRKQELSNTKKRSLGLFNISRHGLLFKDILPLNQLWNQYINDFLNLQHCELDGEGIVNSEEFTLQIFKADFHGAFMEVSKSVCANLVGINGIVVFETRNTIKLLGKDNITRSIPKQTCEFKMKISNFMVTFLGKNLLIRSADRSIKKIRNIKFVEL